MIHWSGLKEDIAAKYLDVLEAIKTLDKGPLHTTENVVFGWIINYSYLKGKDNWLLVLEYWEDDAYWRK